MTRLTDYQTNFASGELDPGISGQIDLKAYKNGARRARNVQRRVTGGLERRWGSYDLNALAGIVQLIDFEFSNTQRYILAFSHQALQVFDLNGVLLQSLFAVWTEAMLGKLRTTQSGDTMVVTGPGLVPQVVTRTGPGLFEVTVLAWQQSIDGQRAAMPFFKFAAPEVTLTPSAATGDITLLASDGLFLAEHVGARFKIYETELLITAVADATHASATVLGTIEGKLDIDPFKTTAGGTVVEVTHLFHGLIGGQTISLAGANTTGSIPGSEFDGDFVITVIDEHRYTIDLAPVSYSLREDRNQDGTPETNVYEAAKESEDGGGPNVKFTLNGAPTRSWLEQSFSAIRGYPLACAFHEGRLWLAGSDSQPDGHWGSNALSPFRSDVGVGNDGDAVHGQAGSEDLSRVQHIVSNGDLQTFTSTRESVFVTREGEAITPNNQQVKVQSSAGTGDVQPIEFDGATLFAQENGLSVCEFVYSQEAGGFAATVISTLAGHLVRRPVSMAASRGTTERSEALAYIVNDDGSCAVFHSMRRENIAGWVLWTPGRGALRSVCCAGPYVFFAVEVPGQWRLYRLADDDLACLDGQVVHSSPTATKLWTLDPRVRNRHCGLRSERGYHGFVPIPSNGAVELDVAVRWLVAGDPFFATIETMPPSLDLRTGPQSGLVQRIVRSVTLFENSYGVTLDGEHVVTRDPLANWADPPIPLNGYHEARQLGFSRAPTLVISQDEPLPMRVLSVLLEVKV